MKTVAVTLLKFWWSKFLEMCFLSLQKEFFNDLWVKKYIIIIQTTWALPVATTYGMLSELLHADDNKKTDKLKI